jgi:predicted nucleotidyltransferase component of viral defense system
MTKCNVTNVAASVRQKLQNVARSMGRPFQEVLQYYAMERFLYRLSQSSHANRFILKGALMFNVWRAPTSRPTKDVDLLGRMENNIESLAEVMRDVCREQVDPDGIAFDPGSVQGTRIEEDADYEGVRVTFRGSLENARIPMQIDIGFGDVVFPEPEVTDYPTILEYAAPKLRGYSRETAIAEKFEAMVKLGLLNSRMKDFYDIWLLSRQFDFDGMKLATAIERTFSHRGTNVVAHPVAFTSAFATEETKLAQWEGFVRKSKLTDAPGELAIVVDAIASFLGPPAAAVGDGRSFTNCWSAPGPWHS